MKLNLHRLQSGRWLVPVLLSAFGAQVAATPCDDAWATYNEFKARTVMEPSQYALTVQGAQVRSACGAHVLPVPPGSDVPMYRPHVRPVPPKSGPPPQAPPPPRSPGAARAP